MNDAAKRIYLCHRIFLEKVDIYYMSHGVCAAHRIELSMKTSPKREFNVPESESKYVRRPVIMDQTVVRIVLTQASDSSLYCVRRPVIMDQTVAIYSNQSY